jgi:hypothetical protein
MAHGDSEGPPDKRTPGPPQITIKLWYEGVRVAQLALTL